MQANADDSSYLLAKQLYYLLDKSAILNLSLKPTDYNNDNAVYKTSSFSIFFFNKPAAFAEADKLFFLANIF